MEQTNGIVDKEVKIVPLNVRDVLSFNLTDILLSWEEEGATVPKDMDCEKSLMLTFCNGTV